MEGLVGLEKTAFFASAAKAGMSLLGKAKNMFIKPAQQGPAMPPLATSQKSFGQKTKDFLFGNKNPMETVTNKNGTISTNPITKKEAFTKDLSTQAKWALPFTGLSVAASKSPQELSGGLKNTKNIGYNTNKNITNGLSSPQH